MKFICALGLERGRRILDELARCDASGIDVMIETYDPRFANPLNRYLVIPGYPAAGCTSPSRTEL